MEAVIIIQIHNSGMVLFWDVAAGKGVRQEWSGGAGGGQIKWFAFWRCYQSAGQI